MEENTTKPTDEQVQTTDASPNKVVLNVDIKDVNSMFEVVDAIPTHTPNNAYDQVKIYVNGATKRLYVYDYKNRAWYYATLT